MTSHSKGIYRLIVFMFVLFLQLNFLLSGNLWMWDLTSFIPNLFIILAWLVVLGVSIISKSKYLIVLMLFASLYVLFISDVGLGTRPPNAREAANKDTTYTVFNWNTEFWEADQSAMLKYVASSEAEIIMLQEALMKLPQGVFVNYEAEIATQIALGNKYTVFQSGELVTATRFPVLDIHEFPSRQILRVDISIREETVSVYNIHIPVHLEVGLLRRPTDFLADMQRRFEIRANVMNELVQDLATNPYTKIIAGDFNAQKHMHYIYPLLNSFEDAFVSTRFGLSNTFSLGGLRLWRIDYVLGQNVAFTSYNELDNKGMSDHVPLLVKFQL